MSSYPAVPLTRDTVELCPNTTQTTGSSETVQRKETLCAMHCKDKHLLIVFVFVFSLTSLSLGCDLFGFM